MGNGGAQLLTIVVILALAYLLIVRPARKRANEVSALQSALVTGDEVMLTSGIFGRIDALDGDEDGKVRIEISPGVVATVHRGAIAKIVRDVPITATDADPDVHPTFDQDDNSEPNRGGT